MPHKFHLYLILLNFSGAIPRQSLPKPRAFRPSFTTNYPIKKLSLPNQQELPNRYDLVETKFLRDQNGEKKTGYLHIPRNSLGAFTNDVTQVGVGFQPLCDTLSLHQI